MTYQYLTVNQTYAFFFGDDPIRLYGEKMFFTNRSDAKAAAKSCGLYITNRNTVKSIKE